MLKESQGICEDLEQVSCCPACERSERAVLISGLRDFTFGAAPGEWTMWRCQSCGCAYLDPRPTGAALAKAYSCYYTHELKRPDGLLPTKSAPLKRKIAARLRNDWINRNFGFRLPGAIPFGRLI